MLVPDSVICGIFLNIKTPAEASTLPQYAIYQGLRLKKAEGYTVQADGTCRVTYRHDPIGKLPYPVFFSSAP